MSYNTLHVIAAASVVTALVLLQVCDVSGTSCYPCDKNRKCPTLPHDCQVTTRMCGCCFECKVKVGANCSHYGLNCESGLMCVNQNGVALSVVRWDHFAFVGTCQKVNMCQVITRSWYDVLRDQRKLDEDTAKVADEEDGIADERVAIPI